MKQFIVPVILILVVLTSGCTQRAPGGAQDASETVSESRSFYMGVVPTPITEPATGWDDIVAAYEEAGGLGEIGMVWVQPSGIGQYERMKQNRIVEAYRTYGLKPLVTLSFATIKEVPGEGLKYAINAPEGVNADLSDPEFRRLYVKEAGDIAREFRPEYFSLGNEVNDYFYMNPEDIDAYLTLFVEAYAAIKDASPETKVFVVLSYTHLIDTGQWELIGKFGDRSDIIGLTTYPWKHYDNPGDIPDDYYRQILKYTGKPVAFTEIGWISSGSAGSSEREQAEFLTRFVELTDGMDVEMVNWLFLHEAKLSGIAASVTEEETATISLKRPDGTQKAVYSVWTDLRRMTYVG